MTRRGVAALVLGWCALVATGCGADGADPSRPAPGASVALTVAALRADVVATLPHDTTSFTEGLEVDGALRYESSGLYGTSVVRAVDRSTGAVRASFALPATFFAEGLTKVGDHLVVLTWKERTAFVLDAATLAERARLAYDAEGWGICALGDEVVTSDGSDVLTFRDPATLARRRSVAVRRSGDAVRDLNELECTPDGIFANVWKTDRIVRIDPGTGTVTGVLDVPALRPASTTVDPDAVLNGIARDPVTGRFLLTGKRWPIMYDVQLTEG